jgi:hypothetical protein
MQKLYILIGSFLLAILIIASIILKKYALASKLKKTRAKIIRIKG